MKAEKKKNTYYRVSIFALGSIGGGHWEDAELVSGTTPQTAYNKALVFLANKGFAHESTIEACDKHGVPFQ